MGKFNDHIKFLVIDLFCGAGGTTTGVVRAWLRAMAGVAQSESIHMENAAVA